MPFNRASTSATTNHAPQPRLLTIVEAAAIMSVSRSTIYSLVNAGLLDTIKINKSVRIDREAIDDCIRRLARPSRAA